MWRGKSLALAELEALARALLAILLALFLPRVARHQPVGLHLGAQLGVELLQRARHAHAHRAGLCRHAAAGAGGGHVKAVRSFRENQGLARNNALHVRHKVFLEALAVDLDDTGAGAEEDAGYARFAASRSIVLNQFSHALVILVPHVCLDWRSGGTIQLHIQSGYTTIRLHHNPATPNPATPNAAIPPPQSPQAFATGADAARRGTPSASRPWRGPACSSAACLQWRPAQSARACGPGAW